MEKERPMAKGKSDKESTQGWGRIRIFRKREKVKSPFKRWKD